MPQINQLLQRLADAGVDFVIIGGFAAVTHGSSFVTRDIDVCAVLTEENVARLRRALADLDPRHRMTPQRLSFLTHPATGQPVQNLYLQTDAGVVDVISSVLGVGDFTRLKTRAERLVVDGRSYQVISLEDLIQAKEALGREKDLLTAKELRALAAKRREKNRA
jgi:predicted nucleotidyltransferase